MNVLNILQPIECGITFLSFFLDIILQPAHIGVCVLKF